MLGNGVPQQVADHGMLVFSPVFSEETVDFGECTLTIIVVGIDNGEGLRDYVSCADHSVTGPPWLFPALGHLVAFRQGVQGLIDIVYVEERSDPIADAFPEIVFHFFFYDEYYLAEACTVCIVQGVVNDDLSFIVNGNDLFWTAETAAHAGGHNDQ